jgi:hypothetical protein
MPVSIVTHKRVTRIAQVLGKAWDNLQESLQVDWKDFTQRTNGDKKYL